MPNFGFDDWIDAQLRSVPVPSDLLSRLAENCAPPQAEAAERIDTLLRTVSVPDNLEFRLRRIARHPRPAPLWLRFGLAASIFLVLGGGVAGYMGLVTGALGQREPMLAQKALPLIRGSSADVPPARDASPHGPAAHGPASDAIVGVSKSSESQRVSPAIAADAQALAADAPADNQVAVSPRVTVTPLDGPSPSSLPFVEGVASLGSFLKQAMETQRRSQAALGARGEFARLPTLEALEIAPPRGMAPPLVPGYDLLFQLKHGEHPFVSPAAHPDLLSSRVPLTFRTVGYDMAVRAAAAGHLPSADEIRVEDFLAAQNYALPRTASDDVALHAAASPSPFGQGGLYLLQLAVQAGAKGSNPHPPTQLIVVADTSSAMRNGARWETFQRGLMKSVQHLTPSDRITLIGFNEQSRVLAENATGNQLRTLLVSGSLSEPAGSADLAGAIRWACEAVRAVDSQDARRVVFITSGREDFDETAVAASGRALAQLADAKVPWAIVRVSAGGSDAPWAELAEQGRGEVSAATTSAEIQEALARKLTGRSSIVASGATLKLTLNPQAVESYRLLGHESTTLTGPGGDSLVVDLSANETATGMFELWLKPKGDRLAVAELSWRDPASGQPRRKIRPISRGQISASFSKAPPWFQQGVIAAKTAEALRGSHFSQAPHPLGQIQALGALVDPSVAEQRDFRTLMGLVKHADKRR